MSTALQVAKNRPGGISQHHQLRRLPRGGHFATWEQPMLFTSELRAVFRTLRREA